MLLLVPSNDDGQGLMRALHQRDGLLTGAAEGNGVHAHHFIAGPQTDSRCHTALLHLNANVHITTKSSSTTRDLMVPTQMSARRGSFYCPTQLNSRCLSNETEAYSTSSHAQNAKIHVFERLNISVSCFISAICLQRRKHKQLSQLMLCSAKEETIKCHISPFHQYSSHQNHPLYTGLKVDQYAPVPCTTTRFSGGTWYYQEERGANCQKPHSKFVPLIVIKCNLK